MKILYHHRTGSPDGQAVHIQSLIEAIRQRGHEVLTVGPFDAGTVPLSAGTSGSGFVRRVLPRSVCELAELGYNLIAFAKLWLKARRHRPAILFERYNLFTIAGVWLKRLYGLPMILEVNAPLLEERSRHGGLSFPCIAAWTERLAWRSADRVLPVTDALAEHVRAAGVPPERILVLPNGVQGDFLIGDDRDAARAELGLEDRIVLGFTGFMRAWHGLDAVLEMVRQLACPELHLLLVGDGPARPALERQARALGVADRVTLTGVVPRTQIASLVRCFDIALQPRVLPYASPLKLQEYMAAGRAIVAPRSPNLLEVLDDGRTALLFDPADPHGLQRAVERLVRDPDLRGRLGAAARREILERDLTWDGNARKVLALCHELCH